MQITVSSPCRTTPFKSLVDNSLVKIGRSLAGGHIPSIARTIFSHAGLREELLIKVMNQVNEECAAICKRNVTTTSLFRRVSVDKFEKFSWDDCISELQSTCPTLLCILRNVVSSSDHRNVHKQSSSHHPGLCMAIAVILKERNREMCGVQTFLSLVLFNSHVQKKVCQPVSECIRARVCVCVSNVLYM